ncbi:putative transglutaminase-like cysteine proteinase [Pseudorhizobium tarimense]|uniref:Transglutaminase-like cysteine proteinase n=1 Tax=Pseudorhizobium tarimense TaxID=1079109 RepID=A0ABV2H7P8_9HYPH|nr:transglutaminase-like cysteine peptidase [Pseudorhizobium tarimense]MCJ8519655.1 transglutaminase-like cysteine peptidase [Pseudorhizobium tarimense]
MSMKRLASMAFMAAIISAPAAYAAGPAGFAASPAHELQLAEGGIVERAARILDRNSAMGLLRVNQAVNRAIGDLDSYFDGLAAGLASGAETGGCTDCADIKRDRLLALGWRKDMMRIAYAVSDRGRIQRVLVVRTDRGEVVLGEHLAFIRGSREQQAGLAAETFRRDTSPATSYSDI